MRVKLVQAELVQSLSGKSVLNDSVLDSVLAHCGTKLGILCDGDSLVVYEDAGLCIADALDKSGDYRLLLAENFCVRHVCFHLRK